MRVLRARLYELEREKQQAELAASRRSQIGTGERAEKIRTYNFPENRVTDHRIKLTLHRLDQVLDGEHGRAHRGASRRGAAPGARGRLRVNGRATRSRDTTRASGGGRLRVAARRRRAPRRARARAVAVGARARGRRASCRAAEEQALELLVARRERREPLAYVLGEWGFRRLTLGVDRARARPATRDGGRRRALSRADRGPRRAARPRRRDGERRDRARDRGRASGRARDRHRRVGRTRSRSPERTCSDGPRDRAARVGSLRGPPRRAVGPRRLQPAVRPAGGDRARSSRRFATGSRARRSSAWGRPRPSRAVRSTCFAAAARSCSRSRRATLRGSRRCSRARRTRTSRRRPTSPDEIGWSKGFARREHVDEVVAAIERGRARRHPDRHRVRPCVQAGSRGRRPARSRLSSAARREQPIALVAASVERSSSSIPELLGDRVLSGARSLSSSPNPARRLPWLGRERPDTIGVRAARARGPGGRAPRAGRRGRGDEREPARRPDPRRIADVPDEILAGVAAVLDGGELPGTPSTVVDLTGPRAARPARGRRARASARLLAPRSAGRARPE